MGITLNYEISGTGSPVIILHGLFGCARNWQGIARKLAASHQVITVDLRNHGGSTHTETMSYEDMAADIRLLMRENTLARATLIGHSMGGKTAMVFALLYPELLEKLLVLDIAPVAYTNDYDTLIDTLLGLDVKNINSRSEAEKNLQANIDEQILRHFLLQNLVRDEIGFQWRINLSTIKSFLPHITGFPEFDAATQFHGETLFLGGEHSNYIRQDYHPRILSYFPNAQIAMIEDAAHWLHADQPQAVLESIRNFLRR